MIRFELCSILTIFSFDLAINPLNAELNFICHVLALLEAHHILHVNRIRVNAIDIRISYSFQFCIWRYEPTLCNEIRQDVVPFAGYKARGHLSENNGTRVWL